MTVKTQISVCVSAGLSLPSRPQNGARRKIRLLTTSRDNLTEYNKAQWYGFDLHLVLWWHSPPVVYLGCRDLLKSPLLQGTVAYCTWNHVLLGVCAVGFKKLKMKATKIYIYIQYIYGSLVTFIINWIHKEHVLCLTKQLFPIISSLF